MSCCHENECPSCGYTWVDDYPDTTPEEAENAMKEFNRIRQGWLESGRIKEYRSVHGTVTIIDDEVEP